MSWSSSIYLSRYNYGLFSVSMVIIQTADFDLSTRAEPDQIHAGAIQGEIYRALEVMTTFEKLWDLLKGKVLFNFRAPGKADEHDDQSHQGQISALTGPPPRILLSTGQELPCSTNPTVCEADTEQSDVTNPCVCPGELKNPGLVPALGGFSFENTIRCMSALRGNGEAYLIRQEWRNGVQRKEYCKRAAR